MSYQRQPTLAAFIQALEGVKVVVELRRDTVVRGTLDSADEGLNLQLSNATVKTADGAQRSAATLQVRGRSVRFIHLPGNVEPAAAVEAHRRKAAQAIQQRAAAQGAAQRMEKGRH